MKKLAFAAGPHIRNAVLCAVVTLGLTACGADETSTTVSNSIVKPSIGLINRTTGIATTAGNTAPGSNAIVAPTPVTPPPATTPPVKVVSSGTATLDWTPPTENSDGSTLTNLAGYTVYYGTSPDGLTESVKVSNPGLTAYTVSNLTSGTWYFAVTSYSAAGVESGRSAVVSTTI